MTKVKYAVFLAHWAKDHGFSVEQAAEIVRIARRCGTLNTHAVNGDPHPRIKHVTDDKNVHAQLWENDLNRWTLNLVDRVNAQGFGVRYDGIYPSLFRKGDDSGSTIIIPLDR